MKLILKNEFIHLEGTGRLDLERPTLELDTSHILRANDYKYLISFNDGMPIKIETTIVLPQSAMFSKKLTMKIEAVPKVNDLSKITFRTDELPVTRLILLGKDIEEVYPETIKALEARLDEYMAQGSIL